MPFHSVSSTAVRRWLAATLVPGLVLGVGSALAVTGAAVAAETIPTSGSVKPVVETTPVPHSGDAADDPAIWVNEANPGASRIFGTDKQGGLAVYDLAGKSCSSSTTAT